MTGNISRKEKIKRMCDSMGERPFTSTIIYDGIMEEVANHGRKRKCVPTLSQIEQCISRLNTVEKIGYLNGSVQYINKMVENNDK